MAFGAESEWIGWRGMGLSDCDSEKNGRITVLPEAAVVKVRPWKAVLDSHGTKERPFIRKFGAQRPATIAIKWDSGNPHSLPWCCARAASRRRDACDASPRS